MEPLGGGDGDGNGTGKPLHLELQSFGGKWKRVDDDAPWNRVQVDDVMLLMLPRWMDHFLIVIFFDFWGFCCFFFWNAALRNRLEMH